MNSTAYQVGAHNRLLSDGVHEYEYDNEGNLVLRTNISTGEQTVYTWDHRNRLVQVVQSFDEWPTIYGYDAFNQLVGRYVLVDDFRPTTILIHDGGQVVLQFDGDQFDNPHDLAADELSHRYLWAPAVDQLLADERVFDLFDAGANETLWALTDHLGSVRDMVDDAGTLRLHRAFDSFGNIEDETHYNAAGQQVALSMLEEVGITFAFTGRLFDRFTGLQNNLHRWYDPKIGRWLSEDPIGFAAGDPNLYRYVGNSPTFAVDPSGLVGPGTYIGGIYVMPVISRPVQPSVGLNPGGVNVTTPDTIDAIYYQKLIIVENVTVRGGFFWLQSWTVLRTRYQWQYKIKYDIPVRDFAIGAGPSASVGRPITIGVDVFNMVEGDRQFFKKKCGDPPPGPWIDLPPHSPIPNFE